MFVADQADAYLSRAEDWVETPCLRCFVRYTLKPAAPRELGSAEAESERLSSGQLSAARRLPVGNAQQQGPAPLVLRQTGTARSLSTSA